MLHEVVAGGKGKLGLHEIESAVREASASKNINKLERFTEMLRATLARKRRLEERIEIIRSYKAPTPKGWLVHRGLCDRREMLSFLRCTPPGSVRDA